MKVLVGSDYHCKPALLNQALELIPQVDCYVNCGDFCSKAGAQPHKHGSLGYNPKGKKEIRILTDFLTSVDQLGKPWLFVPGNHDPSAVALGSLQGAWGTMITEPTLHQWQGLRVLSIPMTPPCGWNWTLSSKQLRQLITTYTDARIDVMVTHAPPKGVLDEGGKWYHRNTPTLRPLVDALKPRYYLCGHMHYDGGKVETHQATTFINAALHNMVIELEGSEHTVVHEHTVVQGDPSAKLSEEGES